MSTIASLVTKLAMDNANFQAGAARSVALIGSISAKMRENGDVTGHAMAASGDAIEQTHAKASGYLKTLLGIAGAGATIANGVKHAFASDKAQMKASGDTVGADNMARSLNRVQMAVQRAWDAFGVAFSKTSGLGGALDQLANIVSHLAPAFKAVGGAIGSVVGFFSQFTPLAFAVVTAFKLLAIAAGVLLLVLQKLAIRAFVIWLTGMSPLTLAWTAGVWLLNTSLGVMNGLLAYAAAIGAPVWLVIGAAIAIVAGAVFGLCKLWEYMTTATKDACESSAEMIRLLGDARKEVAQAAMNETQRRIDDLKREQGQVSELEKSYIRQGEALKAQAAARKADIAAMHDVNRLGMSGPQRAIYDLKTSKGVDVSRDVQAQMLRTASVAEAVKLRQKEIDLAVDLAKLGTTGAEQRLIDLDRELGFITDEHAAILANVSALEAEADVQKQLLKAAKELDQIGMNKVDKAVDESRRSYGAGAQSEEDLKSVVVMESLLDLNKKLLKTDKELRQSQMSGTEKLVDDLLRENGLITDQEEKLIGLIASAQDKIDAAKEEKTLAKQIADLQRDADEAGLSDMEKRAKKIKEIVTDEEKRAELLAKLDQVDKAQKAKKQAEDDAQLAKRITDSAATPLDKYQKQLDDIVRLRKVGAINDQVAQHAAAAADKDFRSQLGHGGNAKLESPSAVLRGSAESLLLANRQKSPIDKVPDLLKTQIAAQKEAKTVADRQLAAIQANKPPIPQVASI